MRINHDFGGAPALPIPGDITSLKGKNYHVFIGIPSRDETCYVGLVGSMAFTVAGLVAAGVEVTLDTFRNSSFPDIPRNYILKRFWHNENNSSHKPYTHCVMVDDDMAWDPPLVILEMMTYNKPFIGGVGPLKRAPHDLAFAGSVEAGQDARAKLLKMINIGGGMIMMTREMIGKMIENYEHLRHPSLEHFPMLFERLRDKKQDVGEDMMFCKRWRDIGGEVWAYTDIDFEHLGHAATVGNYRTYMINEINNPISKHVKRVYKQTA